MLKKILLVMFCFFSGVAVLGFATYKGFFNISRVNVAVSANNQSFDVENLVKVGDNKLKNIKGQTLFGVSLESIYEKLKSDPRIQDIKIKRKFPNEIGVELIPKQVALSMMSFKHGLHSVTSSGSILPVKLSKQDIDLPILRGANFHKDESLRVKAVELLKEIPERGLFSIQNISEIRYNPKNGFILHLVNRNTLVRLGKDNFAQKSSFIERAMSYLESQRLEGRVIDARYSKKVVVKLRNEP